MELNKISSFKSFSEMRNEETAIKTEQENKVKRVKSLEKISAILDELQISDMSELDEEKRKALYSKLFNEDREEEIVDDIAKLGEPTQADPKDGEELESELDEANITLDALEPTEKSLVAFCKKKGIKWKIINMNGPAGGHPEVEYVGKTADLEKMIKDFWGEDSGLEEFIEEGVLTLAFDPINGEYIFEARSETKVFKLLQKIFAGAPLLTKDKAQHVAIVDGLYMDAMEDANFYNEAKDASFAAFQSFFSAYGKAITVDVPGLSGTTVSIGKKEIKSWQEKWTSDISSAGQWNGYDITLGFRKYLESIGEPNVGITLDTAFGKANESYSVKVNEAFADLQKYIEDASKKTFKGGGNGQNLLDNAMGLAYHIGENQVGRDTRGHEEDGWYEPATLALFKKLVDSMSADDIKNNREDTYESVITEGRSINKIQNEFTKIINQMKNTAELWKQSQGDEKAAMLNTLKDLTAQKKKLEAELDDAITDKDKDLELVVSEGNGFNTALFAARNKGEKTFEFNGKTYKVTASKVNEAKDVKTEVIDKLSQFFSVPASALMKFNFDGKDPIKDITKALNGTDYEGVENIVRVAIKAAKRDLGVNEEEIEEGNAFGAAVTKAKEAGEKEFEFDGKTYKVEESKYNPSIKIVKEQINEAAKFTNTKNFIDFCEEIDGMPESAIKKIMGKDYIDTPGNYNEESDDYDDIEDYMISNMGRKEFERLQDWWEANVAESAITEAEVKSDEEFKEYAFTILKKAFGDDFDEAKAQEVVDGILKKCDGDYGACVGTLTSSLG